MDHHKYSTLRAALADVPDPRAARGKQHDWLFLLIVICAAVLSQQRTPHAIAHWGHLHADELLRDLRPPHPRMPSESTVRRVLRRIDVVALEHILARWMHRELPAPPLADGQRHLRGQAVDGKQIRGVATHGAPRHLVSLVQHDGTVVLAQTAVNAKRNEISVVPALLAGRDLTGTVTTMDALLTQARLAQQIRTQGGHYLMVVKHNQPQLYADLDLLFATPPLPADAAAYRQYTTITKGHGRLETRRLVGSTELCGYVAWPDVGQVLQRTCERTILKTGKTTVEITYGITSLTPDDAEVQQVEQFWRGHWAIENRVHYVRDVTFGEDAGHAYTGNTAHALAALRNALLNLIRSQGWTNVADALRVYAASISAALSLLGVPPLRL